VGISVIFSRWFRDYYSPPCGAIVFHSAASAEKGKQIAAIKSTTRKAIDEAS